MSQFFESLSLLFYQNSEVCAHHLGDFVDKTIAIMLKSLWESLIRSDCSIIYITICSLLFIFSIRISNLKESTD
jgi:hypothetical protein